MSVQSKRLFLSPPHMSGTEMDFLAEVFASNFVAPAGPMIEHFEKNFCEITGFAHACALSSGTAAIHLALRVLGVSKGDDVWLPSLTFIGGVSPITYLGARPVFLDCAANEWGLDTNILEVELHNASRSGSLPSAVISVDLYGHPADHDRIAEICGAYGVPVVSDSAESMGSIYKDHHSGKAARVSVYSFNGNKIITTGGGGMIASDDKSLIDQARFLSQQAREPVAHYEHQTIGYNYRMSALNAAVGVGQLLVLKDRVTRRREIFQTYTEALSDLPGVTFMQDPPYGVSNHWLSVMLVEKDESGVSPEDIRLRLEADNIESRPVWKPMHMQPVFKAARVFGGHVARKRFETGLCLPSGSQMTIDDQSRVIARIRSLWGK